MAYSRQNNIYSSSTSDQQADEVYYWHQIIDGHDCLQKPLPALNKNEKGLVIIGYCSDEGVRQAQGRAGAARGPEALRKVLSGFPVHDSHSFRLVDCGDILDINRDVEATQLALAKAAYKILDAGYFTIVLGGGHELSYGHFLGIASHLQLKNKTPHIGIINFDAHFDLRPYKEIPTSGTPFLQVAHWCQVKKLPFFYFCLGIQEISNQKFLFQTANRLKADYITATDLHINNNRLINKKIDHFIKNKDAVYVTVDLDVFAAPFAPGVSAPSFNGVYPDVVFQLLYRLFKSRKVVGFDIAELNPKYDIDNRTARLGAAMVYEIVKNIVNQR